MKLFIFDVDGVLRDNSLGIWEGMRRGFEHFNLDFPFSSKDISLLRSIGKYDNSACCIKALLAIYKSIHSKVEPKKRNKNLNEILKEENAEELIDKIVKNYFTENDKEKIKIIRKIYKNLAYGPDCKPFVKVYPFVKEAMKILHGNGFKLAIWTNAAKATVYRDFPHSTIKLFSQIIGGEDANLKKPSGKGILKICKNLDIDVKETAYIGDSPADMQAAKEAGCKAIGILYEFALEEEILKEEPDHYFQNVLKMAKHFTN